MTSLAAPSFGNDFLRRSVAALFEHSSAEGGTHSAAGRLGKIMLRTSVPASPGISTLPIEPTPQTRRKINKHAVADWRKK